MSHWPFTSKLVEAARLAELLSEFAFVKICTPRAVFMYEAAEKRLGSFPLIEVFRFG